MADVPQGQEADGNAGKDRVARRHQEGLQRIQVGLTGLAGIIVIIGMVNVIISNLRTDTSGAAAVAEVQNASNASEVREPMAELGVAPSSDSVGDSVVPDLRPDPKLHKPMDRTR